MNEPLKLNLPQLKPLTYRLIVHVFEGDEPYPRVTHIFNGGSQREVLDTYRKHRKHDKYLRSARKTGSFEDQPLRLTSKWHQLTSQGWMPMETTG